MPRYTTSRRSSSGSTHQHHHNHHQSSSTSSSTSSSPRSASQRPRLLRSSATTPAITAPSSEIQGSVISPNSPHTAAEMLNRMAPSSYYQQREEAERYLRQQRYQAVDIERERERSGSAESFAGYPGSSLDDGYFSFPEFDGWEREEEGHELKQEGE